MSEETAMKNKTTISLREYLKKLGNTGRFIIPEYQRGYIWGQYRKKLDGKTQKDSVTFLIESILRGYETKKVIFLQGITVCENEQTSDITLVDGQQRTTFFFLLLKYLGYKGRISMYYSIRKESDDFLSKLNLDDCQEDENEPYQDIYFFKKTIRIFNYMLDNSNRDELLNYILDYVSFLYITIPPEKAKIIFSLMNGNKAIMKQEELIKSELLRRSSLNTQFIHEAENNTIRSRLAREWDKWLYWWNDNEVKDYYCTSSPLGWLLPLIEKTKDVSFEDFRTKCLVHGDVKEAKAIFRKMRLLQQRIEDAYNNALTYNYIGAILKIRDKEQHFAFLKWYFIDVLPYDDHDIALSKLKMYFDWTFIYVAHTDIERKNIDRYNEKRIDFFVRLDDDQLYRTNYEIGARWLLRCNILEDCSQNQHRGRKFNFNIWGQRSLEHIFPKSQVGHKQNHISCGWNDEPLAEETEIKLWREDIILDNNQEEPYSASENSIGNLVLLYKDDNSKFNASDFEHKKNLYFQIQNDTGFQSRHLLHTVSIFASSEWEGKDIARHKKQEIERFIKEYPEL